MSEKRPARPPNPLAALNEALGDLANQMATLRASPRRRAQKKNASGPPPSVRASVPVPKPSPSLADPVLVGLPLPATTTVPEKTPDLEKTQATEEGTSADVVSSLPRTDLAPSTSQNDSLAVSVAVNASDSLLPRSSVPIGHPTQDALAVEGGRGPAEHDDDSEEASVKDVPWSKVELDLHMRSAVVEEMRDLLASIDETLAQVGSLDVDGLEDVRRRVHTLKGTAGMAGAMRARKLIHRMETVMDVGGALAASEVSDLLRQFARARQLLEEGVLRQPLEGVPILTSSLSAGPPSVGDPSAESPSAPQALQRPSESSKLVRVPATMIDALITEANEAGLSRGGIETQTDKMRRLVQGVIERGQRLSQLARELEMATEEQIEFRRSDLQDANAYFDPLEMDRFTRLQELSRFFNEGVTDIHDFCRDMVKTVSEQETQLAYQEHSIQEMRARLHRTRLTPFETVNDRLHRVAFATGHELNKEVTFTLKGGSVELDRVLLERLLTPIEHVLRNAVVHGIEPADARLAAGKSAKGNLRIAVRQEAGRFYLTIDDDGRGLVVDRIRAKAVSMGLWKADRPMSDQEAADMVCLPRFSTAEDLTEVAGRGVGMDVVRAEILALGGGFELVSRPGRGLSVNMQVPTTVATAPVLVATVGSERWALPVEIVADIVRLDATQAARARESGLLTASLAPAFDGLTDQDLPFGHLASVMGIDAKPSRRQSASVLILREGARRLALEADDISRVLEAPLRPVSKVWAGVPGIVGATVLPDGMAAFVVDPLRVPGRGGEGRANAPTDQRPASRPLVLVVDDSITVRKATTRFLEQHDFDAIQAKDGQEALSILASTSPAMVLLDVEMPRMDGFECARQIRESTRHRDLPIVMITSRLADKHRDRALSLGVSGYLGKPFKEEVLLELLQRYARVPAD